MGKNRTTHPTTAPYGAWRSPIKAASIAAGAVSFSSLTLDGPDVYWIEMRSSEGGRYVLVRRSPDGQTIDITPPGFNVRTTVHEYGGGAYSVKNGIVYFSNFQDQRLYRQAPGETPVPLTPPLDIRYADGVLGKRRDRLYIVREDHTAQGEAVNTLVCLDLSLDHLDAGRVVASGYNFYSNPRLSPDGNSLCWLAWNHPNMPWDGNELWVAELNADGSLLHPRLVAGGKDESIFQPDWSPDGVLYFVSDRTGWWNLYRSSGEQIEAVYPMQAEFGQPQWNFGMSTYAFLSAGQLACYYTHNGRETLLMLDTVTGLARPLETGYSSLAYLKAGAGKAFLIAGSPSKPSSVISIDIDIQEVEVLRVSRLEDIPPAFISTPQPIEFPTKNGLTAYGFYYAPTNPDFIAPPGEMPPLVVLSHGGPTGSVSMDYSPRIYYLTSRGFAILDVNYGGSTGYGREYRRRLIGQWGIVDVDDCVNGARCLVLRDLADGNRLAIAGGSAGGYTTLSALTFCDIFKVGVSRYGIGDLEVFAHDTHKFESRYMDSLIGPYPERKELYHDRSPINFTDRLSCALILFQGLEDKIVPPNQAELMYQAVNKKGLPVAYLTFAGEQHGFRKAENVTRMLEAELFFYSKIFGFNLPDPVEPVEIKNLHA
jgi:dipeptidyl aminopeptidase/acylaminoacyl peptidase